MYIIMRHFDDIVLRKGSESLLDQKALDAAKFMIDKANKFFEGTKYVELWIFTSPAERALITAEAVFRHIKSEASSIRKLDVHQQEPKILDVLGRVNDIFTSDQETKSFAETVSSLNRPNALGIYIGHRPIFLDHHGVRREYSCGIPYVVTHNFEGMET